MFEKKNKGREKKREKIKIKEPVYPVVMDSACLLLLNGAQGRAAISISRPEEVGTSHNAQR